MGIIWGLIGIMGVVLVIGGAVVTGIMAIALLRNYMKREDKDGKY